MKKRKSIRYYTAYVCTWALAMCFLNTITDTAVISFSGMGGYNEIESIAEWVTEDLLDIENAFPEDEEDNDVEKKTQQMGNDWENCSAYQVSIIVKKSRLFLLKDNNHWLSRPVKVLTPPPDIFC